VSAAAWYRKKRPTFSDTLAAVRRQVWAEQGLLTSRRSAETAKLRPALRDGISYALCHAA
jgi:predicted nucleic-acid-binding protein